MQAVELQLGAGGHKELGVETIVSPNNSPSALISAAGVKMVLYTLSTPKAEKC